MSKARLSTAAMVAALLFLMAGCCTTHSAHSKTAPVAMPEIANDAIPYNGSVIEYWPWPNHTTKSQRVYREGKVIKATYFASDGTVVYEMTEKTP